MAVTFRTNYIEVTSGANQQIASNNINAGGFPSVNIHKVRWVGGTTAGHNAQILDASSGNVIWEALATAANFTDETTFEGGFELRAATSGTGLHVTLDSGVLYIYSYNK